MGFLADLSELISPTRCAGCDLPGTLLCDDCRRLATRLDARLACKRCGAPFGNLVCTECWQTEFAFSAAVSLGELAPPLSRAVVIYKDGNERRLGEVLGALLAERVLAQSWLGSMDAVTWVPASREAVARRGFDHAERMARSVALSLGIEPVRLLEKGSAGDQRQLGRSDRAANMRTAFSASGRVDGRLLLVDDVFTTGATLDEATGALLEAGAAEVLVAVLARAW